MKLTTKKIIGGLILLLMSFNIAFAELTPQFDLWYLFEAYKQARIPSTYDLSDQNFICARRWTSDDELKKPLEFDFTDYHTLKNKFILNDRNNFTWAEPIGPDTTENFRYLEPGLLIGEMVSLLPVFSSHPKYYPISVSNPNARIVAYRVCVSDNSNDYKSSEYTQRRRYIIGKVTSKLNELKNRYSDDILLSQGKKSGGKEASGGDPEEIELVSEFEDSANFMINDLRHWGPKVIPEINPEDIKDALNRSMSVGIDFVDGPIYVKQGTGSKPVVARNWTNGRIEIDKNKWGELTREKKKILALHELLGTMNLEINTYQITLKYKNELQNIKRKKSSSGSKTGLGFDKYRDALRRYLPRGAQDDLNRAVRDVNREMDDRIEAFGEELSAFVDKAIREEKEHQKRGLRELGQFKDSMVDELKKHNEKYKKEQVKSLLKVDIQDLYKQLSKQPKGSLFCRIEHRKSRVDISTVLPVNRCKVFSTNRRFMSEHKLRENNYNNRNASFTICLRDIPYRDSEINTKYSAKIYFKNFIRTRVNNNFPIVKDGISMTEVGKATLAITCWDGK